MNNIKYGRWLVRTDSHAAPEVLMLQDLRLDSEPEIFRLRQGRR